MSTSPFGLCFHQLRQLWSNLRSLTFDAICTLGDVRLHQQPGRRSCRRSSTQAILKCCYAAHHGCTLDRAHHCGAQLAAHEARNHIQDRVEGVQLLPCYVCAIYVSVLPQGRMHSRSQLLRVVAYPGFSKEGSNAGVWGTEGPQRSLGRSPSRWRIFVI